MFVKKIFVPHNSWETKIIKLSQFYLKWRPKYFKIKMMILILKYFFGWNVFIDKFFIKKKAKRKHKKERGNCTKNHQEHHNLVQLRRTLRPSLKWIINWWVCWVTLTTAVILRFPKSWFRFWSWFTTIINYQINNRSWINLRIMSL
jgi:hypothetical protein